MRLPEFDLLQRFPACYATLQAYWGACQQQQQGATGEFDGWIDRLTAVPDVPPESLSGIHGKLIAFGYLKFELTAKDATLRYQVTPLGRSAMTGESPFEAATDADLALSA
jgi:hypothetical protein